MKNKLNIIVYGAITSGQQLVVSVLRNFLTRAEIAFDLTEETNVDRFIAKGLNSVPAIEVDGVIFGLKTNGSFNMSLRLAITHILSSCNFGHLDRIVVPIDFSDVSVNAFVYGHRLATDMNAVTQALHVFSPKSADYRQVFEGSQEDLMEEKQNELKALVAKIDVDWGSDILKASLIDPTFKVGFAVDEIITAAQQTGAKMIVMGSTGDSGPIKRVFGSVSTEVMKRSDAMVMVVPGKAQYHGLRKVLYAYNDIRIDEKCVQDLAALCKGFDTQIHLLHIYDKDNVDPGYYLKEVFSRYYTESKIVVDSVHDEDVVSAINAYVADHHIDAVAMGTKKRSFWEELTHHSLTREMSFFTKTPLLVLKA